MTRNNLPNHLAWLLSSRSNVPIDKDAYSLPSESGLSSLRSTQEASQAVGSLAAGPYRGADFSTQGTSVLGPITSLSNDDRTGSIRQSESNQALGDANNDMARLQAASRPREKPRLLSNGHQHVNQQYSTSTLSRDNDCPNPQISKGHNDGETNGLGFPIARKQVKVSRQPLEQMDVDAVDLTADEEAHTSSSSTFETFGSSRTVWQVRDVDRLGHGSPRGKKRKSGELQDHSGLIFHRISEEDSDEPDQKSPATRTRSRIAKRNQSFASPTRRAHSPPLSAHEKDDGWSRSPRNVEKREKCGSTTTSPIKRERLQTPTLVRQTKSPEPRMAPLIGSTYISSTLPPSSNHAPRLTGRPRRSVQVPFSSEEPNGLLGTTNASSDAPGQKSKAKRVVKDSEDEDTPDEYREENGTTGFKGGGALKFVYLKDSQEPGARSGTVPLPMDCPVLSVQQDNGRQLKALESAANSPYTASPYQADSPTQPAPQSSLVQAAQKHSIRALLLGPTKLANLQSSIKSDLLEVRKQINREEDDQALDDLVDQRKNLQGLEQLCVAFTVISSEYQKLEAAKDRLGQQLLEAMDANKGFSQIGFSAIQTERLQMIEEQASLDAKASKEVQTPRGQELMRRIDDFNLKPLNTIVLQSPSNAHSAYVPRDPVRGVPQIPTADTPIQGEYYDDPFVDTAAPNAPLRLAKTTSRHVTPHNTTYGQIASPPPSHSSGEHFSGEWKVPPNKLGTSLRKAPSLTREVCETDVIKPSTFESPDRFSRRMGTPEAASASENGDEFYGIGDDDEDQLLECEKTALVPVPVVNRSPKRGAFQETSGNQLSRVRDPKTTARLEDAQTLSSIETPLMAFPWSKELKSKLHHIFHLRGFRQNQLDAINATLAGKDAFVLMPTGGGKSLCYQLPSIIRSGKTRGITLVFSPLLSLMLDQVEHLTKLGVQATMMNGDISAEQRRLIMNALKEKNPEDFISILYITPEMIVKNQGMLRLLIDLHKRNKVARMVIDEAHCVSQWGHDFRKDYIALKDVRNDFKGVPVMALTATATENVKVDVMHNLGMIGCQVFNQSFNRPNLVYDIRKKPKGKELLTELAEIIKSHKRQSGIIYCFSRKDCETLAQKLVQTYSVKAHHYHAGMPSTERIEVQKAWQAGQHQVIVATIAFGMGIDKADVRFVIHHSIPSSLEGYYQETGRAGRDGMRSTCYLYYGFWDSQKIKRMVEGNEEASFEQKDRRLGMLRRVVQFCENRADCRRVQVLAYFNEHFKKEDCNGGCDVCGSTTAFKTVDYSNHAAKAIAIVKKLNRANVTLIHCVDVFGGRKSKKIKDLNHDEIAEFGAGSALERSDGERVFQRLLSEGAFEIDHSVNNASGFPFQWIRLGKNASDFESGRRRLKLVVETDFLEPQVPRKRKAVDSKSARKEHPQSTNVSSPLQKNIRRKAQTKFVETGDRHQRESSLEDFVVSDDAASSTDDCEESYFEPKGKGKAKAGRPYADFGPPITTDDRLNSLTDIHRDVVEEFVQRAKRIGEKIRNEMNLREVPFTDTIFREMAINWTESIREMRAIPSIDKEKVELHGRKFIKLVKEAHKSYELMMRNEEDKPLDPHQKNVIILSSSDDSDGEYTTTRNGQEEDDNAYGFGDIEDADLDDIGTSAHDHSRFFAAHMAAPTPKKAEVSRFNAQLESATQKAASSSTRRRSGGSSGKGTTCRFPTRSFKSKAGGFFSRGKKGRGARRSSSGTSRSASISKDVTKRKGKGGNGKLTAASFGGGGIPLMPT